MSQQAFCVSVFQRLLARPDATFLPTLALACDASRFPTAAAQQAAEFEERIRDLSLSEAQELYDETFGVPEGQEPPPGSPGERWLALRGRNSAMRLAAAVARLDALLERRVALGDGQSEGGVGADETHELLELAARISAALVAARNPYHHLLAGLYAILQPTSVRTPQL